MSRLFCVSLPSFDSSFGESTLLSSGFGSSDYTLLPDVLFGGNISGIRLKYFHKVFEGIVLPEYIDWVKELVYIMVCIEETVMKN